MDELERLRADILNKVDEYYRLSREQQEEVIKRTFHATV